MEDQLEELRYPIGKFVRPSTYTEAELKDWISVLEHMPSWMDACIENMDAHQLDTPYRPDGWTIKQVVHHVADSHANAYIRLKLALTEENPTVKPYAEDHWANLSDVQSVPVNVSITMLHTLHIRMVAVMKNMQSADWDRTYFHPQYEKTVPLWEMAAMYAWHSKHHTAHIMNLRNRMNW